MSEFNWKSPYVIGGAGLLVVLLLVVASHGSAPSDNGAGAAIASQGLATNANVQLAGLETSLQATEDQIAGSVAIANAQQDTATFGLALGFLNNLDNNNLARTQTDAAVRVNTDNNATYRMVAPELATISANNQQALATISANEATSIAGINASAATTIAGEKTQSGIDSQLIGSGAGLAGNILNNIGGIASVFGL
jgi:hypothetical protein